MTTITLETIKTAQNKIAEMIAAFESQEKIESSFPITVEMPTLNTGERYVGAIISADGSKRHHIILLPGERDEINWQDAKEWAVSIGGELPDRNESALLFATMKNELKPEWYWTREQHVSDSCYAWLQNFDTGGQYSINTVIKLRARAVRRLEIQ